MQIFRNHALLSYNTFQLEASARLFIQIDEISEIHDALQLAEGMDLLILGGGSNVLLTKDWDGAVIWVNWKGIEIVVETEAYIECKVAAGESWHSFVLWAIEHNFGGIENLSLIPGSIGAAPMQNIGAYGVEVKDVITQVNGLNLSDNLAFELKNEQCQFGYRESIFKKELKGKVLITSVHFKLTKPPHQLAMQYGAIKDELVKMGKAESPTIADVSQAVISIRQSKLPDPKVIGNAGSFFKNPEISTELADQLKIKFPNIVSYKVNDTTTKIPAGWLIEQCGWKGKTIGKIGCHKDQALVLVNHGGGKGAEILQLAHDIQLSVQEKFGIALQMEVNCI